MRLLVVIGLLLWATAGLTAASIVPGIFNGHWTATNARTETVTSGPLSIVFPLEGRPVVHLWIPWVRGGGETVYIEHSRAAATPTRRSVLCTFPGVGRLHGAYEGSLGAQIPHLAGAISGTLRLHGLGRGTFSTERFRCSPDFYEPLIQQQRQLFELYGMRCLAVPTNIYHTNIIRPQPPIRLTNFPPLPPPAVILTNVISREEAERIIEARRHLLHSNNAELQIELLLSPAITNIIPVLPPSPVDAAVVRTIVDAGYSEEQLGPRLIPPGGYEIRREPPLPPGGP